MKRAIKVTCHQEKDPYPGQTILLNIDHIERVVDISNKHRVIILRPYHQDIGDRIAVMETMDELLKMMNGEEGTKW